MAEKGAGVRAEKWVMEAFPGLNRRQVREAIAWGWIRTPDGARLRKGDRLDSLPDCRPLEAELARLAQGTPDLPFVVIAEGSDFLVLGKPSGYASHPVSLADRSTATQWVLAHYPAVGARFSQHQPELAVHRLDTGTAGLLIVATTPGAHSRWREFFSTGEVGKEYLAWVWGVPAFQTECLRQFLALRGRKVSLVSSDDPKAREAESEIQVLRRSEKLGASLVRVRCRTGVTHQVRVQLASIGLPLVGDALYDPAFLRRIIQPAAQLLVASRIDSPEGSWSLPHPERWFNYCPLESEGP